MRRPPHGGGSKGEDVVGESRSSTAGLSRKGPSSETAALQPFERLLSDQFRSQVEQRHPCLTNAIAEMRNE